MDYLVPKEVTDNRRHIKEYDGGNGVKVLGVDTRKVTYQGKQWHELSSTQKHKFENLLVLTEPKQKLRFNYQ